MLQCRTSQTINTLMATLTLLIEPGQLLAVSLLTEVQIIIEFALLVQVFVVRGRIQAPARRGYWLPEAVPGLVTRQPQGQQYAQHLGENNGTDDPGRPFQDVGKEFLH